MPQMAPMSWILLFAFFSLMLMFINILNYYLYNPILKSSYQKTKINIKSTNWLW